MPDAVYESAAAWEAAPEQTLPISITVRVDGDCGSAYIPQMAPETRSQWEQDFSADLQLPSVLTAPPPCYNDSSTTAPTSSPTAVSVGAPATVAMTFTSSVTPDETKLQTIKEQIAKAAGVDVANVTLAVNSSSDGSSVISATVAVDGSSADVAEAKLEEELGSAANATKALGVPVTTDPSIVETPASSATAAPTSSPAAAPAAAPAPPGMTTQSDVTVAAAYSGGAAFTFDDEAMSQLKDLVQQIPGIGKVSIVAVPVNATN